VFKAVFDRTPEQEVRPILKMAPELAPVLRRLLQRNPADRYQSASEVLEDLVRVHAEVDVGCDLTTFMSLVPADDAQAPFSPGTLRLPGHTDERWSRFLASRTGMEIPIIEDPLDRTDPGEETTRRDDPAPAPKPVTKPGRRRKKRRKPVPAWKRRMKSPLFWAVVGAGALVAGLAAIWASGL